MSADAKVWQDGNWWHGVHDGACAAGPHEALDLAVVLQDVAACLQMRFLKWEFRQYVALAPEERVGLVGYIAGGA
jgi:hypothetical protein